MDIQKQHADVNIDHDLYRRIEIFSGIEDLKTTVVRYQLLKVCRVSRKRFSMSALLSTLIDFRLVNRRHGLS